MNSDIIEKIKKLRELSNSPNIHEATAAAIAADKLISKFRISEQEISDHDSEKIEEDKDVLYESARSITWKYSLAISLAKHYSCFIFNRPGQSENYRKITRLCLAGVKSDMEIVKYMFTWIVFEIERLNKANKGKGHIVCNSFCLGAVMGIDEQLKISKKESNQEAIKNGQEKAIQILDQRAIKAEALIVAGTKEGKLKNSTFKPKNYIDGKSYDNGVNAGKNIHLGKVMGSASTKLLNS